jgi:hypothetical protein
MTRRRRTARLMVAVTLLSAVGWVGALDASAASKTVSPGAWLTKVCASYAQMEQAVDTAGNTGQLAYANANQSDATAMRTIFQTRFQQQLDATTKGLAAVKKAGTPAVANGKQLQKTATSTLTTFQSDLQQALQMVSALPADTAALQTAVDQLYSTAYTSQSTPKGSTLLQALMAANPKLQDLVLSGRGPVYKAAQTCT